MIWLHGLLAPGSAGGFLLQIRHLRIELSSMDYESTAFTRLLVAQTPPVGFEPTIYGLEGRGLDPLGYGGL